MERMQATDARGVPNEGGILFLQLRDYGSVPLVRAICFSKAKKEQSVE